MSKIVALTDFGGAFAVGMAIVRFSAMPIAPQIVDVGEVDGGSALSYVLQMRNWSPNWVRVRRVQTACGCAAATPNPEPIPPLGMLSIPIEVNLAGKSGPFQTAIVAFLDSNRQAEFIVKATVIPAMPAVLDVGSLSVGSPTEHMFRVPAGRVRPLEIHSASVTDPRFEILLPPAEGETPARTVVVRMKEGEIEGGPVDATIHLDTNDSEAPLKTVRVIGRVLGPVEVDPKRISFGYTPPNSAATVTVKLFSPRKLAIAVESVAAKEGRVRCEETETKDESERTYKVRLSGKLPASGLYKDEIEFNVRVDGRLHHVIVDVYGYSLPNLLDAQSRTPPPLAGSMQSPA